MKNVLFACIALFSGGCATVQQCPSVSVEPVSMCRAKAACGGVGAGVGMILGGMGGSTQPVDQYNRCVQNDLQAQSLNARYATQR